LNRAAPPELPASQTTTRETITRQPVAIVTVRDHPRPNVRRLSFSAYRRTSRRERLLFRIANDFSSRWTSSSAWASTDRNRHDMPINPPTMATFAEPLQRPFQASLSPDVPDRWQTAVNFLLRWRLSHVNDSGAPTPGGSSHAGVRIVWNAREVCFARPSQGTSCRPCCSKCRQPVSGLDHAVFEAFADAKVRTQRALETRGGSRIHLRRSNGHPVMQYPHPNAVCLLKKSNDTIRVLPVAPSAGQASRQPCSAQCMHSGSCASATS